MIQKNLIWLANAKQRVSTFPRAVRETIGHQLWLVQNGIHPTDSKVMSTVGTGVLELRVHHFNEYRVIYIAKFMEAVYVIHAFVKKTQSTSNRDVRIAATRYRQLISNRETT